MRIRRVVTGHSSDGEATVASDREVEAFTSPLFPGNEFHRLWGADEPPVFPDDGSPRPARAFFPPVGGFRFIVFSVPPQSSTTPDDLDVDAETARLESELPGLLSYMELDHPGMHTTDTIDFEYVISGEVWLELDDGREVHLRTGDTVVQNGTRHAWRNKGAEPCRMVAFIVGARRR